MNTPHGNKLVNRYLSTTRTEELLAKFDQFESIKLDENLLFDFVNIATGVYSPLKGFLTRNDFRKVLNDLCLESGVPWTLPIFLDIEATVANSLEPGETIGLRTQDGTPVGILDVEEIYRYNKNQTSEQLFGTADLSHPGVRRIQSLNPFLVGGEIKAFRNGTYRIRENDLTPKETRVLFKSRGWDTIVGFQTRNVPHRAHEYLQRSALELHDGLLIQPKIGEKKEGDYTDQAIVEGYKTLIDNYYPSALSVLSIFKSRMWYGGPREAIHDAIVRKNFGCTHFVVGRDHAGVADFYDDFAAQTLFEQLGDIKVKPLFYHYAFYCDRCDGPASEKICPHGADYHHEPSGTKIRETLSDGEVPSSKLMRREVAETILAMDDKFISE